MPSLILITNARLNRRIPNEDGAILADYPALEMGASSETYEMTKLSRIILGISICAVLGIALTLIPVPRTVHAQSGSIGCRVGFCVPPTVSPCAGGGTPPFSGSFGYAYGPAQGTRAMLRFNSVPGCSFFVTNINGSIVTNTPTSNEVTTLGVWQSSDTNCGSASLGPSSYFNRVLGTNLYQLSDKVEAPAGVSASVPYLAAAPYVCVGYYNGNADWWESIDFGYGYE